MAADNDLESRRSRIAVERMLIMQHVDDDSADLDDPRSWNLLGPAPPVVVPPNSQDRRDKIQRLEDFRASDVARVDD